MDDYSDDVPFWDRVDGKPILVLPYALDSNDMKMWTAPGLHPRRLAALRRRHVRLPVRGGSRLSLG